MKTFYQYLSEASIVNGRYGSGHKIEVSKRALPYISDKIKGVVELTDATDDAEEIGSGSEAIYVKSGKQVFKINGSKSGINNSFVHAGAGGKSDTHKTTKAKEAASLIIFKHYQQTGNQISEDEMIEQLPSYGADPSVFTTKYYDSAVLQLGVYKRLKHFQGKNLIFEFQGDRLNSQIYKKAKQLGGPSNSDNWNPADLWIFEASLAGVLSSEISKIQTLAELNFYIRKKFLTGFMLPLSLKASKGKAKIELINPLKYKQKKLEYDFSLERVVIAGSLKSVFIETKSGFTFKANARSAATNPTLYLEGTMKGENFAMGAIDAKQWQIYNKGTVLNGTGIKPSPQLLNQARDTFSKYKNVILKKDNDNLWNPEFDKMDKVLQQRYIAAASLLSFVMKDFDNTIRWGFFTSMKINDNNSMYVKIS